MELAQYGGGTCRSLAWGLRQKSIRETTANQKHDMDIAHVHEDTRVHFHGNACRADAIQLLTHACRARR
jgi:hypothetical protein